MGEELPGRHRVALQLSRAPRHISECRRARCIDLPWPPPPPHPPTHPLPRCLRTPTGRCSSVPSPVVPAWSASELAHRSRMGGRQAWRSRMHRAVSERGAPDIWARGEGMQHAGPRPSAHARPALPCARSPPPRRDLLDINGQIFVEQAKALNEVGGRVARDGGLAGCLVATAQQPGGLGNRRGCRACMQRGMSSS